MRYLKFIIAGIVFGLVMAKSEVISWYRIQEMFRFHSFHMYGIIGVAVVTGMLGVFLIKKWGIRDMYGNPVIFVPKETSVVRYLAGGSIFGMGWALSGACPGPMVVNVGYGYATLLIVFIFSVIGTYLYGVVKDKLPH